ncbi:MAG: class I SAM-dependent RNA methyltransferase [Candidatus Latescibacterota bacterium]|nr:MAG: class I SAM-dependent RNA methyltransferase [Candidatus Latescibacterota bacterium]
MFEYRESGRYFGQIALGLEDLGREELESLGAAEVKPAYRGLHFRADRAALYRINYRSALLTRVLAPLRAFRCPDEETLYRIGRSIDWRSLFTCKQTFAIDANTANSRLRHSRYAAQKLKDAIVDRFRDEEGKRPTVDPKEPDVWLSLHIHADRATIALDTSGGSLHRRRYRKRSVEAPMQETLAAAMVRLAEWDGDEPLLDPMCGSGTLLAEALLRASRTPPGYLRPTFGFRLLPDFDEELWRRTKQEEDAKIRALPDGLIEGSDIDPAAVSAARENLRLLPGGDRVRVRAVSFREREGRREGVVLCNPPYGVRSGRGEDLASLYSDFGDFLKRRCPLSRALVYFGDRRWIKSVGLRPAWKKAIANGGLDGRLARYDLFDWEDRREA